MDAHVSEIFTSSPLIVDIYGFCGLSMLSEYLSLGDMEEYATPDGTRHDTAPLTLDDKDALDPRNSYTAHEKLTISLEMAESLALLHSNVGGVIVHDDVQLGQFLPTEDGHIKVRICDCQTGLLSIICSFCLCLTRRFRPPPTEA